MKFIFIMMALLISSSLLASNKKNPLPLDVKYEVSGKNVKVNFIFGQDLRNFQVENVRGIDGLAIDSFPKAAARNVTKNEVETMNFIISKSAGLSYLVLDLRANVNGVSRSEVVSIPVGHSRRDQMVKNNDIMTIQSRSTAGSSETVEKKIHRVQLQEEKKKP